MTPLKPVAPTTRVVLGILFFILFIAVWAGVTLGGLVNKTFLADPLTMLKSGWTLLTTMGFGWDIGMTVWRVLGGFIIGFGLFLFVPNFWGGFGALLLLFFGEAGAYLENFQNIPSSRYSDNCDLSVGGNGFLPQSYTVVESSSFA